ncbi:MAG: alkaline phosphatase family protein [Anaerolineae bacterium]|nr:alkaline phosphatase family protein [Anaerolineae bacterium]
MTLAATCEQTIQSHRLMTVESTWADEIVFPYYNGLSIPNLAHTVTRLLEDDTHSGGYWGSSPLDPRLWESHRGAVRRVILFISDGLGWQTLQSLMAEDETIAQVMADLQGESGALVPITSIAPSTTAAALPGIWAGAPPAATGMVGTTLFLREFGTLSSMLHYWPEKGRHRPEVLEDWGLDFETFMPLPVLGEALQASGIPTYLLLQKDLFGTGLSRIMHRGVDRVVRHYGYTDLWVSLRDLLAETRRSHCFVAVYWGGVDAISHLHGTITDHSIAEIRRQLVDLRDALLDGTGDGQTLFMFAADHGHTPIPTAVNLSDHPLLSDALRCWPGGESRFAYLYLRSDYRDAVIDYVRQYLGDKIAVLPSAEALQAGLFGPNSATDPHPGGYAPHPEAGARLGDVILVARKGVAIHTRPAHRWSSVSRHGSLTAREMLVPLLLRRM